MKIYFIYTTFKDLKEAKNIVGGLVKPLVSFKKLVLNTSKAIANIKNIYA